MNVICFFYLRVLLTDRQESRFGEKIAVALTKPFQLIAPTLLTTPIEILAKSIIANTIYKREDQKPVEIVDNCMIFELAKMYDNKN